MSSLQIEPKSDTTTVWYDYISISVTNLVLNQECCVNTSFYDKDMSMLKQKWFVLKQPDYDKWTTDQWLIEYVCNLYGLKLKNGTLVYIDTFPK